VTMIAECRDMQLKILSPDINRCEYAFVPLDDNTILYGLGAIKGLGLSAIEAILEVRDKAKAEPARSDQPFKDLFDLCKRLDLRKVNRRVLESLIRAGALDALGPHRAAMMVSLDNALAAADQHTKNINTGQEDLFGEVHDTIQEHQFLEVPPFNEEQRLEGEKETLGLYFSGHPIQRYEAELARRATRIVDLKPTADRTVVVAGLVVAMRTMNTRRGDRMAFVTLDDRTGRLELAVFSELYTRHRDLLGKDNLLVVEGHVSVDEYSG